MLIEIENITKTYPGVAALRDVSLRADPGEFLALIGPSGSGKSTLMNLLGLLDTPTSGVYRFAGHDVDKLDGKQRAKIRNRHIGFVFQGFHLLPRLTALENVALPLIYAGVSGRERRRQAEAVLSRVGLADRLKHRPGELSGGQQQRVAIARALVVQPALILADEPTGNLDSATGAEVLIELRRMHRESYVTVILVTHDHNVAAAANRVVTMLDGQIVGDMRLSRAAA